MKTTRKRYGADFKAKVALEALRDALMRYGTPEIFNTDQGSQLTTPRFTEVLERRQIRISMDGRRACRMDRPLRRAASAYGAGWTYVR